MRILVDTHALIWWFEGSTKLSKQAVEILTRRDNVLLLSAVTGWELAIKVGLKKFKSPDVLDVLVEHVAQGVFGEVPIALKQAIRAGLLPLHHRDPFDRLLVAQAQDMNLSILSADTVFDRYDVRRVW
jgi:PIN domain nuclease of toxin-antitoxin system